MRILITGVTGYAGFYAAIRLAAAGHQVTGLARNLESPRLDLLRYAPGESRSACAAT